MPKGPLYIHQWFNDFDKYICSQMAVLYAVTCYVKQHRLGYLISRESILSLIVVCPILLTPDLQMTSKFYTFIAISRYLRVALFCIIMLKYHELGDTDYDRQINYIFIILVLIVIVSSGLFSEIENSQNLEDIHLDGDGSEENPILIFKDPDYFHLQFHDALYFVIVTLITLGYGDINPSNEFGQLITLMMIIITIIVVPQQTTELLRLISMQSEFRREEYKGTEV